MDSKIRKYYKGKIRWPATLSLSTKRYGSNGYKNFEGKSILKVKIASLVLLYIKIAERHSLIHRLRKK